MNHRSRTWRKPGRLAVILAATGLAAIAVVVTSTSALAGGKGKPTIVLANNSWEGSTANNVVAQYVIEKKLGYNVNLLTIDEIPAWPAMVQGKVSAVLEVWGHSPLYSKYVTGNHQVTDAGLEGPDGNIGWYVPTYLMQQHPELKTWKGVQKDWKLFVTPQSSPQGQFLDGSASYVTNDQALVTNLKINLKVVFAGTEAAQLTEIEQDYKAKKPVLFYWYTPQYQNALYKFSQVALPPWTQACAKLKPAADQLRVSAVPPLQGDVPEPGQDGSGRRELHQALQLDVGRPELGLLQPRGQAHEQRGCRGGVRQLAPGARQFLVEQVDAVHQDGSTALRHVSRQGQSLEDAWPSRERGPRPFRGPGPLSDISNVSLWPSPSPTAPTTRFAS